MALSVGLALVMGACASAMTEDEYRRAQAGCVAIAKTREVSDACRAELRRRHVQNSDGGHP